MTILVMYLGFKSLVWLFACIHYVNIVLFHWVYFILLFGYFIEQNICFFLIQKQLLGHVCNFTKMKLLH